MRFAMWCDLRSWGRSRRGAVAGGHVAGGLGPSGLASGPGRSAAGPPAIRANGDGGGDGQPVRAAVLPAWEMGPGAILARWAGRSSSRRPGPVLLSPVLLSGVGRSGRGVSSCPAGRGRSWAALGGSAPGAWCPPGRLPAFAQMFGKQMFDMHGPGLPGPDRRSRIAGGRAAPGLGFSGRRRTLLPG